MRKLSRPVDNCKKKIKNIKNIFCHALICEKFIPRVRRLDARGLTRLAECGSIFCECLVLWDSCYFAPHMRQASSTTGRRQAIRTPATKPHRPMLKHTIFTSSLCVFANFANLAVKKSSVADGVRWIEERDCKSLLHT